MLSRYTMIELLSSYNNQGKRVDIHKIILIAKLNVLRQSNTILRRNSSLGQFRSGFNVFHPVIINGMTLFTVKNIIILIISGWNTWCLLLIRQNSNKSYIFTKQQFYLLKSSLPFYEIIYINLFSHSGIVDSHSYSGTFAETVCELVYWQQMVLQKSVFL